MTINDLINELEVAKSQLSTKDTLRPVYVEVDSPAFECRHLISKAYLTYDDEGIAYLHIECD